MCTCEWLRGRARGGGSYGLPLYSTCTFATAEAGGGGGRYGRPTLRGTWWAEQRLPECSCPRGEMAPEEPGWLAVPARGGSNGRCGAGGTVLRLSENMEPLVWWLMNAWL